jgi:sugar (glycoside-pentoside-hexuronide) transporter
VAEAAQVARQPAPAKLHTRQYLAYALASSGTGMVATVPGVLLMYYMTSVLGIAPALAGLGLFLPKMWDMVWDPMMGALSDRTRSPWGRRRPYLLAGALLTSTAFALLFAGPDLASSEQRFIYVALMFVVCATSSSVFAVPYIAMASEMSDDPHERTVIMSWRMAFVTGGLLMGSALGPALVAGFGGGIEGYRWMGALLGCFCCAVMLATFVGTRRLPLHERTAEHIGLLGCLKAARANRPFLVLLVLLLLQLIAEGCFAAAVPYFVVHVARLPEQYVGLVMLVLFGTSLVTMPLWVLLARRVSKPACLLVCTLLFAASLALLALWRAPAVELALALVMLAGASFGGVQLFPFSMLTDTIAYEQKLTGQRREGMYTGLLLASEKAGLALGPLVAGLVLSWNGFVPAQKLLVQSESALQGIRISFGVLPALLLLCSTVLLRYYVRAYRSTQEIPR